MTRRMSEELLKTLLRSVLLGEHMPVLDVPKVESPCWEWRRSRTTAGYGNFLAGKVTWYAHRAMWRVLHGEIPAGMLVCHRCDNPPCYNPAHLFLGTKKQNNVDMWEKGRGVHPNNFKKFCIRGHPLKEPNLYWYKRPSATGGVARVCRTCALAHVKARKLRIKSEHVRVA